MAVSLLRGSARLFSLFSKRNVRLIRQSERSVMATRARLDKVLEDLQKNPYFDKYAKKIAKLQESNPDEFLQRIENQEKKLQQKKVTVDSTSVGNVHSLRTFPFLLRNVQQPLWSHVTTRRYSNHVPENVYVTTPVFYVNAGPHIGHLYTAILADAISRYKSMRGNSVFLCTGTDEHGTKVEKAASAANLPITEYCAGISRKFQDMCDTFQVDYSRFIRTTESQHREAVHHFWNTLQERGHIYLGKYSGWYCVSEEAFLTDMELTEIKDATGKSIKVSLDSGNPVEWTTEDSYKFRLSQFQDDLKYWLKDENVVRPSVYHKMLSDWVEDGTCLQDLCISRPVNRVPWAIPTPSDKSRSIYVWLDALVNYLTALGYPDSSYRKFWPPTVQVIGKDILKFHGVYWPAFLIAAGLEPPKTLLCHAHWTVDDLKMSKSKGNVISPFEAANDFTVDGLRYFLLRHAVPHSDANYNVVKIQRLLNAELAHTLGNLVNRCLGKSLNPEGEIPDITEYVDVLRSDVATKNLKSLVSLSGIAEKHYEEYNLNYLVNDAMSVLHMANQMVDYHKPWQLRKQSDDPNCAREMKAVISLALETARVVALILYPIVPKLSSGLLDFLLVPHDNRTWDDTTPLFQASRASVGSKHVKHQNTVFFRTISNS